MNELGHGFTVDNKVLTPSMKLRRPQLTKHFQKVFCSFDFHLLLLLPVFLVLLLRFMLLRLLLLLGILLLLLLLISSLMAPSSLPPDEKYSALKAAGKA